ncbi:MAG: hypothetical protein JSV54_04220 [Chloroflexota bacterium]|nr:MAG: hypothetical protein JSV54_04220 [Chloroflexota bacterium]
MQQVPEVSEHCQRCLKTERWHGNVVLMVVDAAFTSIGLNYFQAVVPKVDKFRQEFVETRKIRTLEDLATASDDELESVWRNKRSWHMAKSVASYLAGIKREKGLDDRQAFTYWAKQAQLDGWEKDPIGQINGVGINSFQYLRMMGGIDTVMPDKIVKRVIAEILTKANMEMSSTDIGFVRLMDRMAQDTNYRAIELCWMTWMVQSEAGMSRMEKYSRLLPDI